MKNTLEKGKIFYHTFEFKDREITLCVRQSLTTFNSISRIIIGYSVKTPEDKQDKELGKKIALGRSLKSSLHCNGGRPYTYTTLENHVINRYMLLTLAKNCEHQIKKGEIIIKGIR